MLIVGIFAFEHNGTVVGSKHFDNGEISFDYPSNWNMTNGTGSVVASFTDSNGLNVTVRKQQVPDSYYDFIAHNQLSGAENVDKNFQLVSKNNITVNGITGLELNYNWKSKNGEKQRKEIWFEKNNMLYNIIFTGPSNVMGGSGLTVSAVSGNAVSGTMVKSLKINETKRNPNKSTGWAELQMPSVNKKWTITTISVDVNNAVYHIPSSYWPGENGEFALMGHHTTHHAPFLNIENSLKIGDPLIVNDYVTGKKYTYKVTSNGNDIRWGAKGDEIKYKATAEPELLLITCWPPGYSRGAYIVHSKLVSVEPII